MLRLGIVKVNFASALSLQFISLEQHGLEVPKF